MRMVVRATGLLLAAAVLVLAAPAAIAQAQTTTMPAGAPAHPAKPDQVPRQDATFLVQAHQSNLAEIATGRLAERKAASPKVQALGRMFVRDHTRLDAELAKVARKLGVRLPSAPNAGQKALAAKLEKLSGGPFDRAWLNGQIAGHREAIAAGDREIARGSNSDVVLLAKRSAPVIKHHLQELLGTKAGPRPSAASTQHESHGTK
jgi:putative membrane protein